MSDALQEDLLVASRDELRALDARAAEGGARDDALREAAALALEAHDVLASSIAGAHPRELAEVVIARYRRRWKWRMLLVGVFVPLGLIVLTLFGVTITTLVTAFLWRP